MLCAHMMALKPQAINLVVALVVMILPTAWASSADVNIHNDMGEAIQVHCNAYDFTMPDPVRDQTLPPGHHVGFGFKPSPWGSTRYSCGFRWAARAAAFDVWVDTPFLEFWRFRPCTHCLWRVTATGFYRGENGPIYRKPVFVHPWK